MTPSEKFIDKAILKKGQNYNMITSPTSQRKDVIQSTI